MSYTLSGTEPKVDKCYYHDAALEVGFYDRIEFGIDTDFAGRTVINAKLLIVEERAGKFALSAGVQNFIDSHGDPFVVGRLDFSSFRLHAGLIRDDHDRLMLGIDMPLCGEYYLMADHMSGVGGFTWFGVGGTLFRIPGASFTLAAGLPAHRTDGIQHYAYISYGFKF